MGAIQTYFLNVITKQYVDFSGRASRKQFWMFVLFYFLVNLVLAILSRIDGAVGMVFTLVTVLYYFGLLLPTLAAAARRLRDAGLSPWLLLLSLVPFLGNLILLVMCLLPTKENNY